MDLSSDLVGHVAALCDPLALPHLARVDRAWRAATRRRWEGLRDLVRFLTERDGRVSWAAFSHWWEGPGHAREKRGRGLCIRRHVAAFARALERGVLLEERLTHLRLEHLIDLPPSVPFALALPASLLDLTLEQCGTLDLRGLRLPRARKLALRRSSLATRAPPTSRRRSAACRPHVAPPERRRRGRRGRGAPRGGPRRLALVYLSLRCNPWQGGPRRARGRGAALTSFGSARSSASTTRPATR